MSKSLNAAAIASFDAVVKQAYQDSGVLRPHVRTKAGITGRSHRFTVIGQGVATPRIPQTDVVPMNVIYSKPEAVLEDWNAAEYTDVFDAAKVNFDEQSLLATTISQAISRREDQLIIDALTASGSTLQVPTNEGGAGTNLNTAKFLRAKQLLDAGGVNPDMRKMVVHSNNIFGLLGDQQATSSDFNTIRALVNGEIDTWLSFKVCMVSDRPNEGGMPITGAVRTGFAFHGGPMGAVGLAIGVDQRTEVNYVPEKTAWLANGLFSAGSIAIDPVGIVEVLMTEA
ncbi:hypothetical protein HBA54_03180 [Pelagibius litoralis]|uniref:Major capsid protein n=1 Tax=Pelagibius litoralis TaxID=374515 RepID=A0A967C364_9PROT|nr:phage capsid protein [Pelagibius litoralis]NIA67585.1 hypothetical protein [Pelagibius litoralis]